MFMLEARCSLQRRRATTRTNKKSCPPPHHFSASTLGQRSSAAPRGMPVTQPQMASKTKDKESEMLTPQGGMVE